MGKDVKEFFLDVGSKLRWLGIQNQIIDNSDSKLFEFDRQLQYKSDSNGRFESTIAILTKFWSIFD